MRVPGMDVTRAGAAPGPLLLLAELPGQASRVGIPWEYNTQGPCVRLAQCFSVFAVLWGPWPEFLALAAHSRSAGKPGPPALSGLLVIAVQWEAWPLLPFQPSSSLASAPLFTHPLPGGSKGLLLACCPWLEYMPPNLLPESSLDISRALPGVQ